ncbi:MAG: efflux RND transporter periplasmic adaptor subunit, partial [Aquificaceae bacterium]|nr:efflux RND transporter periplasmic adaptor subunit [Aquificaceae bacterium]
MVRSLALIFLTLFFLSCQREEKAPAGRPQERMVVVSLYQLKTEEVPIEYVTKGYFEGEKDVILRPLVSGRVLSLMVEE